MTEFTSACAGITLRDWLAGLAMHALITGYPDVSYEKISIWAYQQADAMIRNSGQEHKYTEGDE